MTPKRSDTEVKPYIEITGISNTYGTEIYNQFYWLNGSENISKGDVIDANGFINVHDNEYCIPANYFYPIITVYKI